MARSVILSIALPFRFLHVAETKLFSIFILRPRLFLKLSLQEYHPVKTAVANFLKHKGFCFALTDKERLVLEAESAAMRTSKIYPRLFFSIAVAQEDGYHEGRYLDCHLHAEFRLVVFNEIDFVFSKPILDGFKFLFVTNLCHIKITLVVVVLHARIK